MFKRFSGNYPRLSAFLFALIGWHLLNSLMWGIIYILLETVYAPIPSQEGLNQLYILPFCFVPGLVNFGMLIYFLIKRRWSALGWIAAGVSNWAIAYLMDYQYGGEASLLTGLVTIFGTPFYMFMNFGF